MIELFSRTDFELKSHIGITPLHVSDDISSLSAILLDDDYYQVLLNGRVIENGFSVLRPEYLILFKAKAYLDLSSRKAQGEKVDSVDIKKHKKDVLRLAVEMVLNPVSDLPESVMEDIHHFINNLREDEYDQNSLKTYRVTNDQVVSRLVSVFEA